LLLDRQTTIARTAGSKRRGNELIRRTEEPII